MKNQINNVLIIAQGERGGTDYVLKSLANWLVMNGYGVCIAEDWASIKRQKYSLIVLSTSRMHLIPALSKQQHAFGCNKFIIWCMGSLAFHDAYYNGRKKSSYPKFLVKLFDILINTTCRNLLNERSLIFTDEVGMYSDLVDLRDEQVKLPDIVFPIPIKSDRAVNSDRFSDKAKSIAWVGRIDSDFKILPLIQLIEDSAAVRGQTCFEKNFTFIIVGSGNAMRQLEGCISRYKEIRFELHEWLSHEELNAILLERVDVLFAMGSSALLGASLGVPTVVVQPYSHESERKLANYRWIDETIGHSLGEFPSTFCKPDQPRKKFGELFNSHNLQTRSRLSKEFSRKFDEDFVFGRMLKRELPSDISCKTKSLLNVLRSFRVVKSAIKSLIGFIKSSYGRID